MGLDLVELTLAIEDAFGVSIPNEVASSLRTPGQVVDFLLIHLDPAANPKCLEQRAFYLLRQALSAVTGLERKEILPSSLWAQLLPTDRWTTWRKLREHMGTQRWPTLQPFHFGKATVGDTARHIAAYDAKRFVRQQGWHRKDVESTVRQLMLEETGVSDFEWSSEFVRDLHLD